MGNLQAAGAENVVSQDGLDRMMQYTFGAATRCLVYMQVKTLLT
jgi:hypothetical protein